MKTTKIEITQEIAQMIVNLLDAGMKHPDLGGARLAMPGAIVLQWLQPVQAAFNAPEDEAVVTEDATNSEEKA